MKLTVIASTEGWHYGDLRRAAEAMAMELDRVDFRDLEGVAGGDREPTKPLRLPFERAVVRSMPAGTLEQVILRMDILGRLEAAGARILNPPRALECAIDKYLSAAHLAAAGLPVPETRACQHSTSALRAYEELGGDVVVKPLFGSEGRGLERLQSLAAASTCFARLESTGQAICLQRFVPHPGFDYRVFTLGRRVLCGMRRTATRGWITNIAQGGRAEPLTVSAELARLALGAAAAVGAEVAGVDILPGQDGRLWVLEVNAVPGWQALAPTTGVDVARELLEYLLATDLPGPALARLSG